MAEIGVEPAKPVRRPFRFVYQDESGEPAKGDCGFVIGLLLVREREPLLEALLRVRALPHFHNELHFHKLSGLRERVYLSAFDALAGLKEHFQFRAIVIDRDKIDLRVFGQRFRAYNSFTDHLLASCADEIEEAVFYADAKTRMREDNFLIDLPKARNQFRCVLRKAEARDSKQEPLLQVTDLLTGCANTFAAPWRSERKRKLCIAAMRLGVLTAGDVWQWDGPGKR